MIKRRLDAELVRRGLAGSRGEARQFIEEGLVSVGGLPARRPATLVEAEAAIALQGAGRRFASRGGDKLDAALSRLDVEVAGLRWLDAGASTGGFTDRLLQGGAAAVAAVDVGYGQLLWRLRRDPRVVVIERTNVRNLLPQDLPWQPDAVAGDLSFISLRLVLPSLVAVSSPHADFVLLVKPQFEVGRDAPLRKGVVRDPDLWRRSLNGVVDAAGALGLGLVDAVPSALPGPAGNREFFVHLRAGAPSDAEAVDRAVREVGT